MWESRIVTVAVAMITFSASGVAQSVEYRSPAGVVYRSQPDTGAIGKGKAAFTVELPLAKRETSA